MKDCDRCDFLHGLLVGELRIPLHMGDLGGLL